MPLELNLIASSACRKLINKESRDNQLDGNREKTLKEKYKDIRKNLAKD